jgi:hypothetical protein
VKYWLQTGRARGHSRYESVQIVQRQPIQMCPLRHAHQCQLLVDDIQRIMHRRRRVVLKHVSAPFSRNSLANIGVCVS